MSMSGVIEKLTPLQIGILSFFKDDNKWKSVVEVMEGMGGSKASGYGSTLKVLYERGLVDRDTRIVRGKNHLGNIKSCKLQFYRLSKQGKSVAGKVSK